MPREVRLRTDERIHDDVHLLVRFNDDADVPNALRLALADAHLYRSQPNSVTVSLFNGDLDAGPRPSTGV